MRKPRIGLFTQEFMDDDSFSLNFRGGSVPQIANQLRQLNIEFDGEPKFTGESSGSIRLRDPDGYRIFIDSAPNEVKKEPTNRT